MLSSKHIALVKVSHLLLFLLHNYKQQLIIQCIMLCVLVLFQHIKLPNLYLHQQLAENHKTKASLYCVYVHREFFKKLHLLSVPYCPWLCLLSVYQFISVILNLQSKWFHHNIHSSSRSYHLQLPCLVQYCQVKIKAQPFFRPCSNILSSRSDCTGKTLHLLQKVNE